jgi:hypothetical protein
MTIDFETIKNFALDSFNYVYKESGKLVTKGKVYSIKFYKTFNEEFWKIFNIFKERTGKAFEIGVGYSRRALNTARGYTDKAFKFTQEHTHKAFTVAKHETKKFVAFTSEKLQNPRYAYPAVIISSIAFLHIAINSVALLDKSLSITPLRESNQSENARTIAGIVYLALFGAVLGGLHLGFVRVFKPNMTPFIYTVVSVASSSTYIIGRLFVTALKENTI